MTPTTEELAGKIAVITIRNLLADLIADAPYAVTHGSFRPVYDSRREATDGALHRMDAS
jgi:hypothetical protein